MNDFLRPRISRPVTVLLVVNFALYVLSLLPVVGRALVEWGALVPVDTFTHGQVWRLVTYMFLHDPGNAFHLLFNMLALWMFSQEIEELWGSRRFMWFYILSGIGAGLFSLVHLFVPAMNVTAVIGASGAVLALLTVYAAYFPDRQVLLFFVLPVNIRVVVIGYALISLFGTLSPHGVVSHITHLGGIIVAIVYLKWYPVVHERFESARAASKEQMVRERVESAAEKKRFFEEQIDPILAKISREGSASLTPQEQKLLRTVAKSKDRGMLKKGKILPFDSFR